MVRIDGLVTINQTNYGSQEVKESRKEEIFMKMCFKISSYIMEKIEKVEYYSEATEKTSMTIHIIQYEQETKGDTRTIKAERQLGKH